MIATPYIATRPCLTVLFALSLGLRIGICGQTLPLSAAQQPLLFESTAASQVHEKVRAKSPGTLVEMFVKVGDPVTKGQILGHTELENTKFQFDLAKQAYESEAALKAAKGQADAWSIGREETEIDVRKRRVEKTRLDWASAMERMYQATYQSQLELKKTQQIQYEYWKREYQNRFLVAPVDGVISEVHMELGNSVNFATHVFTISDEHSYSLPVSVPAPLAATVTIDEKLPIRSTSDQSVTKARVESIMDDPRSASMKIIRLLIPASDFPTDSRNQLTGKKFDVLLPEMASRESP